MNRPINNPRSTLHALIPFGVGTADVESLLSYFCRLAVSHSVSTLVLSRTIAQHFGHSVAANFDWHERQISGIRESALTWSAALSALTSVQNLDNLTFLPWREVISQNGLSIFKRGQFCSHCFADDVACGRQPYFRLAWESAEVTCCPVHRKTLSCDCPSCGKNNVRHAAAVVVPGWCTHCGGFLGATTESEKSEEVEPASLWKARQIGQLLASQDNLSVRPNRSEVIGAITQIVSKAHGGMAAPFSRRIGIAKSTVHHWLKEGGTPSLEISLKIAAHYGLSLKQLLTGELSQWQPPVLDEQLAFELLSSNQTPRNAPRTIDWTSIEEKLVAFLSLPKPISVLEAARRLDMEARQLYLRANKTTRQLGERWKDYLKRKQEAKVVAAWPYLEHACLEIWGEGKTVTRREILKRVPEEILSPVPNLLNVLKEVQEHLQQSEPVTKTELVA
jgi:DNA-binding XRE family transcriptional regulator